MSSLSNIRRNPINSAVSWRTMDTEIRTIAELDNLPGIYGFQLQDRPKNSSVTIVENVTGGSTFAEVTTAPAAGQVFIDYDYGFCIFNSADSGTECLIDYQGGGSNISLENITTVSNVSSVLSKDVSGSSDVNLTASEATNGTIVLSGTLTGSINITIPDNTTGKYYINNSTSGNYKITFKILSGTGVDLVKNTVSQVYSNGTNIENALFGLVPIGSIIAWHKDYTNTPALPDNFVECNGQTLSDAESVYNGQTIPDLNGDERFLRGSATSGTEQADALQGHLHEVYPYDGGATGTGKIQPQTNPSNPNAAYAQSTEVGLLDDGTNGTPRTDSETRPVNMSVVWIMRIK